MACLTVRQPWASLLVHGTKTVEWRNWSTNYRGILWISSSPKQPSREEIQFAEETFRIMAEGRKTPLVIPPSYPTGCIVGSVEIVDCIPAIQAQNIRGEPLETQGFALICSNPFQLQRPIQTKGNQGIWNLSPDLIQQLKR